MTRTPTVAPGVRLSYVQLQSYALQAGFSAPEAQIAAAIALAESGGNPRAMNPSGARGLWQIMPVNNDVVHGDVFDPAVNAKAAYAVYKRQGWHAWTTYGTPAYQKNLKTIQTAKTLGDKIPGLNVVPNAVESIGNMVGKLFDPSFWMRFGIGTLGAFLLVIALVILLGHRAEGVIEKLPVVPV